MDNIGRLSVQTVLYRFQDGKVPLLAIKETDSLKLKGGKGSIELHGFTDAERYLHELLLITGFNNDELKKLQEEWNNVRGQEDKKIVDSSELVE